MESDWNFDNADERLEIHGNFNPQVLNMIIRLLQDKGRVAIVARYPGEINAVSFMAELLTTNNACR